MFSYKTMHYVINGDQKQQYVSYIHHFNTRANKLLTEAKAIWGNQKLNKFPFLKAFEEQQFGQENMKHEPSTHFQYILYTKCTEKNN